MTGSTKVITKALENHERYAVWIQGLIHHRIRTQQTLGRIQGVNLLSHEVKRQTGDRMANVFLRLFRVHICLLHQDYNHTAAV